MANAMIEDECGWEGRVKMSEVDERDPSADPCPTSHDASRVVQKMPVFTSYAGPLVSFLSLLPTLPP